MVKVAIIGAGFMGGVHAAAYRNMGKKVKLVAVCDKNPELGNALAKKYKCRFFEDFAEMLKETGIDVVDICLPTHLHEEYVVKAAKSQKHIFCEKPITLDTVKMDHIMEEIRKNQVRIYIGQVLRFWPEYVKAKQLIDKQELGDIQYIFAARLSQHPDWSDWYRRPENSGGGLLDLHLHDIDFLCWAFGEVREVYATGRHNDYGSWNCVSTILEFESGLTATVQGVMEMEKGYPFTMDLKLVGSRKTYEYTMKAGKNLEIIEAADRHSYLYYAGRAQEYPLVETDPYQVELEHFIDCVIRKKNSDIITIESADRVLHTIEAIKESLETSRKVSVKR